MKSKSSIKFFFLTLAILSISLISIASVEGAIYITTTDNLNNAGEPIPDYDMGSSTCVFNDNEIHPIEFNINLTGALPTNNAYLSLFILDVDWPYEVDEIYFNGHLLGNAIGQNNLNYSSFFVIPNISWVKPGNNTVKVLVDKNNIGDWCADVVNGQLMIDEGNGSGTAQIRTASLDKTNYNLGEAGVVNLEIDTSLSSQTVRIEIILKDPSGNNIAFDTNSIGKSWTIRGSSDEPYSWSFDIPSTGEQGIWTVYIAIYDVSTGLFQSFKSLSFQLGETNPPPTMVSITPNSTIRGTSTAVTISGINFVSGSTSCELSGIALENLLVIDSNTITATVPDTLPVGIHTLSCTTPYGTSQLLNIFTVLEEAPVIEVIPSSHDYGDVNVGEIAYKTFTVKNNGNSAVQVYDIGVYGVITPQPQNQGYIQNKPIVNDRNELLYLNHRIENKVSHISNISQSASTTAPTLDYVKLNDNCTGITITSGQSCDFVIGFSPKSGGIKKGEVSIFYNHPSSPYFAISLMGKGLQSNTFAFVTNSFDNTVSVVDFDTGREVTKINVGSKPMGVVTIPHLKKVYITNYLSHNVTVIDGNNNNIKTIAVGANPLGVISNPTGSRVYVGNYGDNTVCEIDTATDQVTRYIDLRGYAYGVTGLAVSLDGGTLYVNSYANSILLSVNLSTEEKRFLSVGKGPYGIALHPNGSLIYTADYANYTISIVSVSGSHMVNEGVIYSGGRPISLAPTQYGERIYFTDYDFPGLKYFDSQTLTINSVYDPNILQPFAVSIDGQSGNVIVTSRGNNRLYNASKVLPIFVGNSPTSFGNKFIGPLDIILSSISSNNQSLLGGNVVNRPVYNYQDLPLPPHED